VIKKDKIYLNPGDRGWLVLTPPVKLVVFSLGLMNFLNK
jgi:hypothetical protein